MSPQATAITDNWPATIVMLVFGGAVIVFFLVKGKKRYGPLARGRAPALGCEWCCMDSPPNAVVYCAP
ncbi:hypothetical protein GCM10010216_69030 [Streptomyces flaveolus]|nr:hypothetical protein GCM10010216_69030 [Streptomyces flaveolus]